MSFPVREWCVYGRLPDDTKLRVYVIAFGVIGAMNKALAQFPEGSRILGVDEVPDEIQRRRYG